MRTKKKLAFTLVELIVTIVILAILGTIAFISFQGYSRNSRDSVRIADVSNMRKNLEIFITKTGFYPTPDNAINIVYSGAIVWNEGIFGENVTKNIENINKIVTDPLTSNEYTYSITKNKNEYEIGAILEVGGLTSLPIKKTYAIDSEIVNATAFISGNYNQMMTKTNSGEICYIVNIPTIIASDIETSNDLEEIMNNNRLVYNGYSNLPSSYKGVKINLKNGFEFYTSRFLSYKGDCTSLEKEVGEKMKLIAGLQLGYSGTIFDPRSTGNNDIGLIKSEVGNKFSDLYNIYLGGNSDDILTYLSNTNDGPLSIAGIMNLGTGNTFKPDSETIKSLENFLGSNGVGGISGTSNIGTSSEIIKSCGIKYFNIGRDITESQLALYHDGWNNPNSDIRKGNRIAAANRYCSVYGCNPNIQNCVGYQSGKGYNGGGTYIEETNQVMCVGGSDTKNGEIKVISSGLMNIRNISETDSACRSVCTLDGFDNGVSVERNETNIGCSCWDDCESCKTDIGEPLFVGTVQNCNAGVVSTNKNHLNCSTQFIGYSANSGVVPLYLGTVQNCNAGVLTTNPNHLNCSTRFVGYAKSTGDVQLYVGTAQNCNEGVVTTNPNHLNCSTTPIGYVSSSCGVLYGDNTTCNYSETYLNGKCVDPYKSNVAFLLPMTGTNGSKIFQDLSNNNETVSVVGNTNIRTDITDPFGTNQGVGYFDGNGDYLEINIDQLGTGDFTIEFFTKIISRVNSGRNRYFHLGDGNVAGAMNLCIPPSSEPNYFRFEIRSPWQGSSSNKYINYNEWTHVALVRIGDNFKLYFNGELTSILASTNTYNVSQTRFRIGASYGSYQYKEYFYGYMSNFRLTKGVARYTSNFTVPYKSYSSEGID
ncbi:MAG: prepilin-type N-terminal cleavage/methylation domain-containing protein [Candidatus Gracilibacteria bacterium]|nr:prepilin-type N-terminal cleavage/methylation domain-containing protein [Candidatus Gracilibacteria bacterium]